VKGEASSNLAVAHRAHLDRRPRYHGTAMAWAPAAAELAAGAAGNGDRAMLQARARAPDRCSFLELITTTDGAVTDPDDIDRG
jgi:hypothetical protein